MDDLASKIQTKLDTIDAIVNSIDKVNLNEEKKEEVKKEEVINLGQVMKDIETKAEAETVALMKSTKSMGSEEFGNSLKYIMDKGAREFEKKTGRGMTYSEMREMYG